MYQMLTDTKSYVRINLCWAVDWYMLTKPEKYKIEADSLFLPDCIDLLQHMQYVTSCCDLRPKKQSAQ